MGGYRCFYLENMEDALHVDVVIGRYRVKDGVCIVGVVWWSFMWYSTKD